MYVYIYHSILGYPATEMHICVKLQLHLVSLRVNVHHLPWRVVQ